MVGTDGVQWRFVGVCGWPESSQKFKIWELLRSLHDFDGPILYGGDFNKVLCMSEIEGGVGRLRRNVADFQALVCDLDVHDLAYRGQWFTWERGKFAQNHIRERLDRFLASPSLCSHFPDAAVTHLLRQKSDHTPILVRLLGRPRRKRTRKKPSKFESAWLLDEECEPHVRSVRIVMWGPPLVSTFLVLRVI